MKGLPCFLSCLPLFLFAHVSSQHENDTATILTVENMNNDSAKVRALYETSRSMYQDGKNLYALQLSQEAYMLDQKLETMKTLENLRKQNTRLLQESEGHVTPVNEERRQSSTGASNASSSIHDRITEQAIQIEQLQKRLDTLADMKNEFNRRTVSLSEDLIATTEGSINDLSMQQLVTTQLARNREERLYWITSAATMILVFLSFVFYQFYRRRKTRFKLELNQLNNKVLRTQLNPHFIFNALDSIRNYIYQHPELAENYLTRFSTLMRQVLENSVEEKITLEEELTMLKNYMQLEAMRISEGFDYEIVLDESVDAGNTMVPPLILQPMVENSIWHGLNPLKRRGKITIQITENNGLLHAFIEDNGVGSGAAIVQNKSPEKKRSMGLQITRERIALLNRKARAKGKLVQQLFEQGSQVEIAIPV